MSGEPYKPLEEHHKNARSHTTCGLGSWRPQWLQKYLSFKLFILCFILTAAPKTVISSYLSVVLSTIEKEFGLKSKEAGVVYSAYEIAQILFVVFIPFIGRIQRRPLYMGLASMVSAFGMLLIAVPHLAGKGRQLTGGMWLKCYITSFTLLAFL